MSQRESARDSAEKAVRDIRRATRRQYTAVEKIRIVLEGLREQGYVGLLPARNTYRQCLYRNFQCPNSARMPEPALVHIARRCAIENQPLESRVQSGTTPQQARLPGP